MDGVWKSYGSNTAVAGLTCSVPAQSVYGFLGPNGAGKSTTIRMLLGLQTPDKGSLSLFGKPMPRGRAEVLSRVGSFVEAPSLYLHLTGGENLEVHRRLTGLPKSAIAEALETVQLTSVADRLVRHYSSGMKQRLGLAQALLGNPELLLLDEPTNGLDPAGIHEIRTLIQDLPRRCGVTVFLSSHLLSEVEQMATHVAIIARGRLKYEGTLESLRAANQPVVVLEAANPLRAAALLSSLGRSSTRDGARLTVAPGPQSPAELNAFLVHSGLDVSHLETRRPALEDLFLAMTGPTLEAE
jgi:ABC-2 type transport system ATP-binding protein